MFFTVLLILLPLVAVVVGIPFSLALGQGPGSSYFLAALPSVRGPVCHFFTVFSWTLHGSETGLLRLDVIFFLWFVDVVTVPGFVVSF